MRSLVAKHVAERGELENLMRSCINDIKEEIVVKRNESKVVYTHKGHAEFRDVISDKEREKIVEILTSKERVLSLLYDKTFPPKNVRGTRA